MSVVINEFEIVPDREPAAPTTNGQAPPREMPAPPTLRPIDIEEILKRREMRKMRLRAH